MIKTQISYQKKTNLVYNQFNTIDKEYKKQRNVLIPEAEEIAYRAHGPKPTFEIGDGPAKVKQSLDVWSAKWNRTFHETMTTLARNARLTGGHHV